MGWRWQEGRGGGSGCLFLVPPQNDDETIWRLVVAGVCREGNREMGWGGVGEEQAGELHGSVNDFLAVQRDVKDRLT